MYPLGETGLIGVFTQAVLYGLYTATLVHCIRWLIYTDDGWHQRDGINKLMLIAAILIFVLSTTNLALNFRYESTSIGTQNTSPSAAVVGDLTEFIAILTVDAVLIYRCWTVYAKSWRAVCLPVIFWFGSLASAVMCAYYDRRMAVETTVEDSIFVAGGDALIAFLSGNIATNLYSTSAIIYRILRVSNASGSRPKRLKNTVRILAESGILYTSMTAFNLVAVIVGLNHLSDSAYSLVGITSDAINFSMAGITFNLILIRVNQDRLRSTDSYADTGDAVRMGRISALQFRHSMTNRTGTMPESQAVHQMIEERCAEQDGHARGD